MSYSVRRGWAGLVLMLTSWSKVWVSLPCFVRWRFLIFKRKNGSGRSQLSDPNQELPPWMMTVAKMMTIRG